MAAKYAQQQIDKALESLPEELKEAIFSKETASHLYDIYDRSGVTDERAWKISECTGYVLMGLMLPQEFEQALVKDIKLTKKVAQEIAREINRFVFYPVKPALEQLHKMEVGETGKAEGAKAKEPEREEERQEQAPQEPRGEDTYREPVE